MGRVESKSDKNGAGLVCVSSNSLLRLKGDEECVNVGSQGGDTDDEQQEAGNQKVGFNGRPRCQWLKTQVFCAPHRSSLVYSDQTTGSEINRF